MKKTAFKTFVCSFVFSLFILFVINGLFFYTPQNPSQKVKIPSKNISLFFTGETNIAQSAQVRPIKKIALTIPETPRDNSSKIVYAPASQPLPSTAPQGNSETKTPTREDLPVFDDTPLEISQEDILPKETELVSADFDHIMKMPPPVFKDEAESAFIDNEKNDNPIIATNDKPRPEPLSSKNLGDQDQEKETKDAPLSHEPTLLIVAQADTPSKELSLLSSKDIKDNFNSDTHKSKEEDNTQKHNEEQLLIPLQKDINAPQNRAFAVAKAADPNQLAMVSESAPLNSLAKKSEDQGTDEARADTNRKWQNMAEKDTPWVAAKGTKFPKNNKVLEADYYQDADKAKIELSQKANSSDSNVKLAAEMVQNILIPIPEDILKEDPLIPQLDASKDTSANASSNQGSQEKETAEKKSEEKSLDAEKSKEAKSTSEESKGGLLKSITSLFSGSSKTSEETKEETKEEATTEEHSNSFVDRITGRIRKSSNKPTKILPAEMRLAFQPNRAEISGTTLKWIHAFANKVNSDRSVILEIRIDGTSSYALQQKRLNLLHNILTNKGVDYRKINTVFTTREPNSFIIRTVRINSNIDRDRNENSDQAAYYQAW